MFRNIKALFNSGINFNATLPVVMFVVRKISNIKYEIKLGNKTLVTKSDLTLDVGAKYWAELSQENGKQIKISHFKKMPEMLQNINQNFYLDLKDFILILSDIKIKYKSILLKKLYNSKDKAEFEFYTVLLVNLLNNTINVPINYGTNKYAFLQILDLRNENDKKLYIKGFFTQLGPIQADISMNGKDDIDVILKVEFNTSLSLLQEKIKDLGMKNVKLVKKENLQTDINYNSLVDIRG